MIKYVCLLICTLGLSGCLNPMMFDRDPSKDFTMHTEFCRVMDIHRVVNKSPELESRQINFKNSFQKRNVVKKEISSLPEIRD